MLEHLKRAPAGRIINVGSDAHLHGKIDFDNFFLEKRYAGFKAYASSRLATALFTAELADRLKGTGVTANSLHPGHVATNIWNLSPGHPFVGRALKGIMRHFLITPEEGAATTLYLACSDEVAGVTGKYFDKCRPAEANPLCEDSELRKRLWDVSEELTSIPGLQGARIPPVQK